MFTFNHYRYIFIAMLLLITAGNSIYAQEQERIPEEKRIARIEKQLNFIADSLSPGLNEAADFSVSGVPIQEFLRGLAESHNLNISVDPNLNINLYNNFRGEKVKNILLFLCREYQLDIHFSGSIMAFYKYTPPPEPEPEPQPEVVDVSYDEDQELLSVDLKDNTLRKVTEKITRKTGDNIVMEPGLENNKVSAYIQNMPVENALEKLAFANDLKTDKTDDGFFLIKKADSEEEKAQKQEDSRRRKFSGSGKRNQQLSQTEGLYLKVLKDTLNEEKIKIDAVNIAIVDLIKEVSHALGKNYYLFSEPKGKTTTNLNGVSYDNFLNHLLQGTDHTYKIQDSLYLIGNRKLEGLRKTVNYKLKYRSAKKIDQFIPKEMKENVEIDIFKELNSVILSGSAPNINEITNFLDVMDQVVPMVTIEVIILDLQKGREISTGIEAGISDTGRSTGGSLYPGFDFTLSSESINDILGRLDMGGGPINLGKVGKNFYVSLSALESSDNVKVKSTPKLSTLNGHKANLTIGRSRYFEQRTQNIQGSLNPQTVVTQQFQQVEANLSININPIISGDEQVTLEIEVENSDFIGDPPANQPPPTSTSSFSSMIRVRNQEMIVLGGLERIEKSSGGEGVPFLSRIPVLKWLFSSRTDTKNKSKTLIFIKPTIIY